MNPQPDISHINSDTPIFDRNISYTKRFLIGGDKAILSWDGERLKLVLGKSLDSPDNTVLFDVLPQEITKIHLYQRISMRCYIKGQKYLVYYPYLSSKQVGAGVIGGIAPPVGTGMAIEQMRDVTLQSPMNAWYALYKQLGVKVWDDTIIPPTPGSIVGWTTAIFIGALGLTSIVGFTLNLVWGLW